MKPKNIFIVRHGQSEGNVDKTIYNIKPDYTLLLTDEGSLQAKNAGQKLNQMISAENNNKVCFYISPFFRTRQTFEYIKSQIKPENVYATIEDVRLREQEWGNHINPEFNSSYELQRDAYGHFYWRFPNGESCADVYDRVSDFLNTLHRDFEKINYPTNVVIVTHGMTMRLLLMRWFHLTVEQFELLKNPPNCSMFHLKLQTNNKYELLTSPDVYDTTLHNYKYPGINN